MTLSGVDSMLVSQFWSSTDFRGIQSCYETAHTANAAGVKEPFAQSLEAMQALEAPKISDEGVTRLSDKSGIARYKSVLARARVLGDRARAPRDVSEITGKLEIDLEMLAKDLARMDKLQRKAADATPTPAEIDSAESVLTALLSSDMLHARVENGETISAQGVLALLNAGLGCLNLIREGAASTDSIFELVRGEVYDMTNPTDILKLTVKTAEKAREIFVGAQGVRDLVSTAKARLQENPSLSDHDKSLWSSRLDSLTDELIAAREKVSSTLDVAFNPGDGARKTVEREIKVARECLRAFRYDLDRMSDRELGVERHKMGFMERLRRRTDNTGRTAPRLTAADFQPMLACEQALNRELERIQDFRAGGDELRLETAFSRRHFDEATKITHLANDRIRYYFSGREQKLEAFRQKAHKVLDPLVEKGGSRTLQFEVGADAQFAVDAKVSARIKAGAKYLHTARVSVDSANGEVTVTTLRGGQVFAEARAKVADGINAGGNASGDLSRSHTIKYRSVEDFIASLNGSSSLISRKSFGTLACLGKIKNFFRHLGHGVKHLVTKAGFRLEKAQADNAAYAAKMRKLGLMSQCDEIFAHRANAIHSQNATAWTAKGALGANVSFAHDFVGFGLGGSVSYENTFTRDLTTYRTRLDTARGHTREWLGAYEHGADGERTSVGAWYRRLGGEGAGLNAAALRSIERDLQTAEDALARKAAKTPEDWRAFADALEFLSQKLAYVESCAADAGEELDTSVFSERLVNPRVEIPTDVYDKLMQEVTVHGHVGAKTVTENFNVNWSVSDGSLAAKVAEKFMPTSCAVSGSHTRVIPDAKGWVCAWGNGARDTWTIALTPDLTTRALVEFLAEKVVDANTDIASEDRRQVLKETLEDFRNSIATSLGLSTLTHAWDATMGELAKVAPKVASLLNAPVTGAATGLEAEISASGQKRISFSVAGGRLTNIAIDDLSSVGGSLGFRAGIRGNGIGVHIKETLTTIAIDRSAMVRPGIDALMGGAEAYIRMGTENREGFKSLLAHNAPGVLRLCPKVADDLPAAFNLGMADGAPGDAYFAGDERMIWTRHAEASTILAHCLNNAPRAEDRDRAERYLTRLWDATRNLQNGTPDTAPSDAERIDAMTDFAWTMAEIFLFASEVGGFYRDESGMVKTLPPATS